LSKAGLKSTWRCPKCDRENPATAARRALCRAERPGAAGVVVAPRGRPFSVMAFTVANGKITQIDALLYQDRLARLDLSIPPTEDKRL